MIVIFESEKFPESFSLFFQSLTLWLLIRYSHRPWGTAAAGFSFALSAGVRANLFLVLPFIAGWLILRDRPRWKSAALKALIFAAGTAVIIGPIVFRNYQISGVPVLREQATWSLYSGLSPEFKGLHPPGGILFEKYMHMPYQAGLRTLAEIELYWWEKLVDVVKDDPAGVVRNFMRRLLIFFNAREWSQEFDVYANRSYSGFLSLPWVGFWLIGPLGLLGLLRQRDLTPERWLIAGYTVLSFISTVPFKASDRYRLPTVALLTFFAAAAIWQLYLNWRTCRTSRSGERRTPLRTILLLAALGLLCWPDWSNLSQRKTARHEFFVAQHRESQGRKDEAIEHYTTSMNKYDWDPDSPYLIGHLLVWRGETERAREFLDEALRREPHFPFALNSIARIHIMADEKELAESTLQESLRYNPLSPHTLRLLAELRHRQGRVEEQVTYLQRAAFDARDEGAAWLLAFRLVYLGRYQEAIQCFAQVGQSRRMNVTRGWRARATMAAGYTAARYLRALSQAQMYWRSVSKHYDDHRLLALQADYLIGALDEEDFLKEMNRNARWSAWAAYDVGLKRWLSGNEEEAVRAFERCLALAPAAKDGPPTSALKWPAIVFDWAREDLERIRGEARRE
jgi:tetratricopeptide (TPR) repeat protein